MIQRNLYDEISQAIHGVISYAKCGMSFLSSANEVDFGSSAENKMAAIELFKYYIYAIIYPL